MSKNLQISGRLAIAEHLREERIVVFIFETPSNITGQGLAVIGCLGLDAVERIDIGGSIKAVFDARSVVTFDEDIKARIKANVSLHMGKYEGEGVLEDSRNCNFIFSSDIMQGRWQFLYHANHKIGPFSKFFDAGELSLTRLS